MKKVEIFGNYKIHGIDTANAKMLGDRNGRFYNTYDEALEKAEEYVNDGCNGIIIYEAIQAVVPEHPPIVVKDVKLPSNRHAV